MDLDMAMWLEDHFARLMKARMVYPNPHASPGSMAIAVQRKNTYRVVADYRAVKNLIAPLVMPTPNLEEMRRRVAGVSVFCTLDLLQRY